MAYTEKVSLNGTALSFLLYECVNSVFSQEGFLIGDITSEITNHISDSQSDNTRLDTQIVIRTVLPLPSVSLFYLPTGRIREDILSELLAQTASEVVGWYKFRKTGNIKPTFRDKLISKGLQKYFEKHHGRKTFVTCNLTSKASFSSSTHTFTYRFGKMNCFDMYEYIEDVTANLGEKLTGYKKAHKISPHCTFNKIVQDSNAKNAGSSDAILRIQEAVDVRLVKEAQIAAKNECTIRELEAEIKQMNAILSDKQSVDLQASYDKIVEQNLINREIEMANAYVEALKTPVKEDSPNFLVGCDNLNNSGCAVEHDESSERDASPILVSSAPVPVLAPLSTETQLNYASAVKKNSEPIATTSNSNCVDLISFDMEELQRKKSSLNDDVKCLRESSPEY